jgi:hypothetical protein
MIKLKIYLVEIGNFYDAPATQAVFTVYEKAIDYIKSKRCGCKEGINDMS